MKYSIRALMSLLAICVFSNINAQCDDSVVDCPTVFVLYNNDFGLCGADIDIDDPVSNDINCVIDDITNDYNNTDDASDFYPVGSTLVTFTITFTSGETGMCSISIDVDDSQSPEILCPPVPAAQCSADEIPILLTYLEFEGAGGDALDNCALDSMTFAHAGDIITSAPGVCPILVERTYLIMDTDSQMSDCEQMIQLNDTMDPSVTCPDDLTVESAPDACEATADIPPVVTDNCGVNTISFSINAGAITGMDDASGTYEVGVYVITYTADDNCENEGDCTFELTILDATAPVFDMDPPAIDPIACDDPLPEHIELTATDNCGVSFIEMDTLPFIATCGDYEITYVWTASDPEGNESTTMVTFTVMADLVGPVFDAGPIDLSAMSILCDEDLLETETLTATDNCNGLTITVDTMIVGTVCQGMIVTYTWTATDDCLNETEVSTNYTIDPETRLPEIIIPDDPLQFCNDPMVCEATITVPEPEVNGFCAEVTSVTFTRADGLPITDPFPVGMNTITWTAINECNTASMTADQIIEIQDCEGPLLSCNNDVCINLSGDGSAIVTHDHIIIQPVSDNCGGIITQTIQRMDDPCGVDGNTEPGPDVVVCCDDIDDEVMIMAVITDQYGNPSSCMVSVEVKLTLDPVATCPADVTVSCEYPIDDEDMFYFGTLNDDMADAMIITLDDPGLDPNPTLMDGYFTSPCPEDAEVDESIDDQRECNQGLIVRTLTVTDLAGNMGSCTQNIMVVDQAPFVESDITWPDDLEINFDNCVAETDPEDVPGPTFNSDNCSMIAISTEDIIYDEPNSGCFIIERRFTVLDWCQYVSMADPEVGVWRDTQFITMVNNVAPLFDQGCPDTVVVCVDPETCLAMMDISYSATDDCTDDEDLSYTYGIDTDGDDVLDEFGNTNAYSGILDFGFYPISWTVDDQCGNVTNCSYLMSVEDCKAPTAACKFGLAANLNEMIIDGDTIPLAMVPIDIFDASSVDECTEISLSYSSDVTDIIRTFDCLDFGLNTVQLWVTDEYGNQSYCETYVDIQDNHDLCPTPIFSRIAGNLYTENQEEIESVMVELASENMSEENMSDEEGSFLFEEIPMYENYMLTANNDIDHTNGISTLDIIVIQRHILGIEDLQSPYKIIAADINKSNHITAQDLAELRKLILGIYEELPDNESWVFIDAEQTFVNEMEPWNYNEYHALEALDYNAVNMDFIGLKIGDVNNSVVFNADEDADTRNQAFELKVLQTAGQLNLAVEQDIETYGLQFAFYHDNPESLSLASQYFNAEDIFIAYDEFSNVVSVSISNEQAIDVPKGSSLLSISGTSTVELAESLDAEIYNKDFETLSIEIKKGHNPEDVASIKQNIPNPFMDKTSIEFDVATDDQYLVQIHNTVGQLIYQESRLFYAGNHNLIIDEKMLKGQYGVLVLSIQNEHVLLSKKMTRVR